jgi:DivIVA domain-containing protein
MAISFTRPDPSSPSSVASASFTTARKGFEPAEVREFLRMVAAELARLQERERFLERELRTAQRSTSPTSVALDEDLVTKMLGEEAARILHTARDAASNIKIRSEEGAARLLREATDEAQRLREEAEIEAARRRSDATADAEAELEMAKQQGRDMVNEARAYRERVLNELARRREIARQQIEQLVHGRDRLLQAFERSRLVAVDVMAELTPLGEPSEYVNLSPTTGPVPLMVPNMPRPPERATTRSPEPVTRAVDASPADVDDTVPLTVAPVVPLVESTRVVEHEGDADSETAGVDDTVTIFVDPEFEAERRAAELAADELEPDEPVDESVDETDTSVDAPDHAALADVADVADGPDDRVVQLDITHHDPATTDAGDDREPAPVVALFAGETDRRTDGRRTDLEQVDVELVHVESVGVDEIEAEIEIEVEIEAIVVDETDETDETDEVVEVVDFGGAADTSAVLADSTNVDDAAAASPANEHPATDGPAPDPDATTVLARTSADDLFARLRAARAASVAERAVATAAREAEAAEAAEEASTVSTVSSVSGTTTGARATGDRGRSSERVQVPSAGVEVVDVVLGDDSVFATTPTAPVPYVAAADSPFARRDEALTPLITAAARKLKRVLADEQNEVLHALRRKEPVRDLVSMLATEREQAERYGSAIAGELTAAAVAGATSMGMDTSAATRQVKSARATAGATEVLVTEVVQPLRERLARCVGDADGDNTELASLVRLAYREWKNQRIDEHLDDVARTAFGRGALAGVAPGTAIRWVVDPAGQACADAEDNALGGAVSAGECFPTDHRCAPAHNGCRCMIAPAD